MSNSRVPGKAPASLSKYLSHGLKWTLLLWLWIGVAYGATAGTHPTDMLTAQRSIQAMAQQSTGALSSDQIAELKALLQHSKMLEADRLEPATIEATGDLLSRAGADQEFQHTYLDNYDWRGLWARVGIDVDPWGFACLMDRVALSQGHQQIFGTLPPAPAAAPVDEKTRLVFASRRNMLGMAAQADACVVTGAGSHNPPPLALKHPVYPTMPRLRAELLRIVQMDQAARIEPERMSKTEEAAWQKKLNEVDAETLPSIQSIHDRYGFPSASEVGRAGVQAAFLVIQHAITAPKLMSQAAREAKALMDHGDLPSIDYALLVDRVACVIEHKPQRYGTQGSRIPKNYWYCPIAEPDQVNARRAALFLQPLSQEDIYGPAAVSAQKASTP